MHGGRTSGYLLYIVVGDRCQKKYVRIKQKIFPDQETNSRIKKKLKPCKERKESSASGPPGPLVLWCPGPLVLWSSGAGPLQQRSKQTNCTGEVAQGNWKDRTGRRIDGDQTKELHGGSGTGKLE